MVLAGLVGAMRMSAYVASKHGVVGLTKTAALEYAKAGIRVNAVCLGIIHTAMVERIFLSRRPDIAARLAASEPVGRLGTRKRSQRRWCGSVRMPHRL